MRIFPSQHEEFLRLIREDHERNAESFKRDLRQQLGPGDRRCKACGNRVHAGRDCSCGYKEFDIPPGAPAIFG